MIKELELFIFTFVLVYLFYVIFVLCRKNVLNKFPNGANFLYLKKKYNIKINDNNIKKIANSIFLANSFILALAVSIVCYFDSFIVGILVCIIPIILMILVLYHLIGTYYSKKQGGKKDV